MSKLMHYDTPELLAVAAAERIIKYSKEAIKKTGRFTIALSGGNTPATLFKLLASTEYKTAVEWKNVFVFWGDERCVQASSNENNSYAATEILLSNVHIPAENIFPVPVHLTPAKAAASYSQTLQQFFKEERPSFDLILLGMGTNGHTASLFPHTAILNEEKALVKEIFVEEVGMWRISFTAPLINNAKHILFLVAGKDKEPMLKKVLKGKYLPEEYPAQLVKGAEWMISK